MSYAWIVPNFADRSRGWMVRGSVWQSRSCSKRISRHSKTRKAAWRSPPAWPRCARSWPGAISPASSFLAPTASRTNMSRPRTSGWPGCPASPARPASPLSLKDRAVLFVDGRYTLQAAQQIDTTAWTVASLVEPPPESLAGAGAEARRPPRIRPVAAHFGGSRAAGGRLRQGRRGAGRGREQPHRCRLAGAPCPAARPGRRCTS